MENNLVIRDGCLEGARQLTSPNYNQRPDPADVSLLVIHNISLPLGQFSTPYIKDLFLNCLDCDADPSFADLAGLEVSAHLLIERNGRITQFVNFNHRAWHAGVSIFDGRENCNDYSIGIELEGCDDTAYTSAQYESLVAVSRTLLHVYPKLNKQRICGHCDIAPERKTDPGPSFDWAYYYRQLNDQ